MGEDRRGRVVAMPATWAAVLLCALTPVCAVEGRCASWRGGVGVGVDEDCGIEFIHSCTNCSSSTVACFLFFFYNVCLCVFRGRVKLLPVRAMRPDACHSLRRTACVFGLHCKGFTNFFYNAVGLWSTKCSCVSVTDVAPFGS